MSLPLAMALRVQSALDELAGLKARPAEDVEAEQQLMRAMEGALGPVLDSVAGYVAEHGVPGDEVQAKTALGDMVDVEVDLLQVLTDHVGEQAAAALERVQQQVAAAAGKRRRRLPDDDIMPFGMDRKLFEAMRRVSARMLRRFTGRTLEALVEAADVDLPAEQLRQLLGEMMQGELSRLSRHATVDARAEATVTAEQDLGVRWHQWFTTEDDRVRDDHAEIHGEIAEIEAVFSNGWTRPGGLGCRCWLQPWFPPEGMGPPEGVAVFGVEDLVAVTAEEE